MSLGKLGKGQSLACPAVETDTATDSGEPVMDTITSSAESSIMAFSLTYHEPKPFTGKESEDARNWLSYFSKFVSFKKLPESMIVNYFALLLRERVNDWFDKLAKEGRTDCSKVQDEFISHFAVQDIARIRDAGKIWSRSQGRDETVADYFAAMQKLSKYLPLSEDMLLYTILNGLRPQIKAQVLQQDYDNISEMLYAAQKAELAFST